MTSGIIIYCKSIAPYLVYILVKREESETSEFKLLELNMGHLRPTIYPLAHE